MKPYDRNKKISQNADKWLDVRRWSSTRECLAHLRAEGFAIYVTHLDEGSRPLAALPFAGKGGAGLRERAPRRVGRGAGAGRRELRHPHARVRAVAQRLGGRRHLDRHRGGAARGRARPPRRPRRRPRPHALRERFYVLAVKQRARIGKAEAALERQARQAPRRRGGAEASPADPGGGQPFAAWVGCAGFPSAGAGAASAVVAVARRRPARQRRREPGQRDRGDQRPRRGGRGRGGTGRSRRRRRARARQRPTTPAKASAPRAMRPLSGRRRTAASRRDADEGDHRRRQEEPEPGQRRPPARRSRRRSRRVLHRPAAVPERPQVLRQRRLEPRPARASAGGAARAARRGARGGGAAGARGRRRSSHAG